jgi:hypothetical protein
MEAGDMLHSETYQVLSVALDGLLLEVADDSMAEARADYIQ